MKIMHKKNVSRETFFFYSSLLFTGWKNLRKNRERRNAALILPVPVFLFFRFSCKFSTPRKVTILQNSNYYFENSIGIVRGLVI